MDTKKCLVGLSALGLLFSSAMVWAGDDDDDDGHRGHKRHHKYHPKHSASHEHYVYARVIAVEPIMERVTHRIPRRECWQEVRYEQRGGSATGTILGGIVGGVVGHQFGEGRGKDAMTIAGTLLGGSIGNDMSQRDRGVRAINEERCRVENDYRDEQRVSGYLVRYYYGGDIYTRHMDHNPGDRVRVNVTVIIDD